MDPCGHESLREMPYSLLIDAAILVEGGQHRNNDTGGVEGCHEEPPLFARQPIGEYASRLFLSDA